MAAAFTIPTIFTAIDRFTAPVARMQRALDKVSDKAKQISATSAVAGAAILAPVGLAVKAAADYQKSVASFRTIVSDLNDTDFSKFEKQIQVVGDAQKRSYTDVASTFEKIAGLNADFAKTATGLAEVSNAAIVLSKASGDELGPSAESLVGIMNQFGFAADQANRTINALAAGQAVGAANIAQTAEALKIFGAVAKGSNTTIEQSVGLIETLAQKSIMGSEAGTALRGAFTRLQKAGLGYKTGQFQINDALEDAKKKVDALGTAQAKDAYITKLFGLENLTAGRVLLDNIQTFKDFTAGVTNTSEAQKAAGINSATMAAKLEQAKAQFQNLAVKVGNKLLPVLSKLLDEAAPIIDRITAWIDKNPELTGTIIKVAAGIGALLLVVAPLAAGVSGFITIWGLLNAVFIASPIGLIILAITALILVIVQIAKHTKGWGKQWDETIKWMKAVFEMHKQALILGWEVLKDHFLTMVDGLVAGWYWFQNKVGAISDEQYNKNIAQIAAEKKARLAAIQETVSAFQRAAQTSVAGPGWHVNAVTDGDIATQKAIANGTAIPAINPKLDNVAEVFRQMQQQKQKLEVEVKAAPGTSASVTGSSPNLMPKMTSTLGQFGK